MDSIFFHIDVNSAFLSWSAIDQKQQAISTNTLDSYIDIRNIPSIIGGDSASRHGIVLAKSIPAKKYGISTAEPIVSALKKCPNLTIVSPNHTSYAMHSKALMDYLSDFCPIIEQVSIDECYMDFTPISHEYVSAAAAAHTIKDGVRDTFGFTVNIGISDRKVLAKMASDFKKPDLVHTLYSYEIQKKMWPLPVSSLFMCGKSSQNTLKKLGITTIGELAGCNPALLEAHLKSHGILLWEYANGIDSSTIESTPAMVKGIGNSITMPQDALTLDDMRPILLSLAESVAKRLRSQHYLTKTITVEVKYSNFQSCSHQTTLSAHTNTSSIIFETSYALLKQLWNKTPVRLLGIRATKLIDENAPVQMDLFSYQAPQKEMIKYKKIDEAMDTIRQKYGDNAITRGSLLSMPTSSSKKHI